MSHAIIFAHLGDALPPYLDDALYQARLFNSAPIYLIASRAALEAAPLDAGLRIESLPVENLPVSEPLAAFRRSATLDATFRFGFWVYVIERFFHIATVMERFGLENVVHLETDNLLYADLDRLCPILAEHYPGIGVPFDADQRAVAGLIYFRDVKAARRFGFYIANAFLQHQGTKVNDMALLGAFRRQFGRELIDALPVVPCDDPGPMRSITGTAAAEPALYTSNADALGMIFDANALGQYIDGIDPRNTDGRETTGFINEAAVYWLHRYQYMFVPDAQGRRIPHLCTAARRWPIANLHVHSKNLADFLSVPRPRSAMIRLAGPARRADTPAAIPEEEIITSERLQALADISVIDDTSAAFNTSIHAIPAIRQCHLRGPRHHLVVENATQIREVQAANVIFVYTHLLDSFIAHVLPHLTQKFVLLSHSSDDRVTERFCPFLDDVRLIHWFAQNIEIRHPKLTALPIGLANRQWPHGDTGALARTARRGIARTRPLYLNMELRTNLAHRQPIFAQLAGRPFTTTSPRRPFPEYLEELAAHRFCLSPHGNGLDCHRTWEALYLGVIPVVPRGPWMENFTDLPLLAVDRWDAIDETYLVEQEIAIRDSGRRLDKLLLSYWRQRIHAAVTAGFGLGRTQLAFP